VKLVVATTNPGKTREIIAILRGAPVELQTLSDFPPLPEPEETGLTFADNARLKALYYAGHLQTACVADDSGLEIAALDGLPGVHSARWEGDDYSVKFRRIRELLAEKGLETSAARFVCHVALASAGRVLFEAEGSVSGTLAAEPRGEHGFGYDPIFYYPPFDRTLAEVPLPDKAAISHRGQAFRALERWLQRRLRAAGAGHQNGSAVHTWEATATEDEGSG
jgi:XTP/dITP diphosphohydrolase